MTGISRKLPDTERHRLKSILKKIVPEDAGVIIRTAAEGASRGGTDPRRRAADTLSGTAIQRQSRESQVRAGPGSTASRIWPSASSATSSTKTSTSSSSQGDEAWTTVIELRRRRRAGLAAGRVSQHTGDGDLFHDLRVDEQLTKALDRKVCLPSGGSLVIDRTEAMTVIDVNTGKFVGAGGNLEQTVTRNNLEAAEEIVRQLRLRDIGGIIVIDFIDMVLECNRELVLRRLIECLGRDRTKHQVAEVTSLGLVQMTRKRVGEGLLEAFSETCPTCGGRGVIIHDEPVDDRRADESSADEERRRGHAADGARNPPRPPKQQRHPTNAGPRRRRWRPSRRSAMTRPWTRAMPSRRNPMGWPRTARTQSQALTRRLPTGSRRRSRWSRPTPPDEQGEGLPPSVESATAAESPTAGESPADVAAESNETSSESTPDGSSRAPRRRGRRSATRPAGPPVPVG